MTVLDYIHGLGPALPLSKQTAKGEAHKPPSKSELRRWINEGAVLINGDRRQYIEEMPPVVYSLIFFPKSAKQRCTLV